MPPGVVVVLLAGVNLLNNRLAPGLYLLTCATTAGLVLVVARWDGCSWTALGLGRSTLRSGLRWGGAVVGLVLAGYCVAALVPATRVAFTDDRATALSSAGVLWNMLVRVPLGTVLLEEIAFRGVLYAMLTRRYGTFRGIVASSLPFGFWHVLPSLGLQDRNMAVERIVGSGATAATVSVCAVVAGTACAGVVFCELRRRSGSLLVPMGLHWALNGLGFGFAWALAR